ncbi:MAG: sodium:calcium antiporter [Methanobacterium sp.]
MIFDILIFIFLLLALILSGIITTKSISNVSSYLKLGLFATGSIITGIATSTPELAVGIDSAIKGVPELSLGNILGTNVVNLTIIIGTAILIAGGMDFKKGEITKESIYPFCTAFLPIILALDGILSRIDGLLLIIVFIAYIWLLIRKNNYEGNEKELISKTKFLKSSVFLSLGLAGLLISSWYLVNYASLIAIEIGIPLFVVGILMLSIGTSLPELSFQTVSLLHGYKLLTIGDLMGTTVVNSTLIIGITSLLNPILVTDFRDFIIVSIFTIIIIFIFSLYLRNNGFTRLKALILIFIYVIFLILIGFSIS